MRDKRSLVALACLALAGVIASGCSVGFGLGVSVPIGRRRAPERRFYPRRADESEEGMASWYGRRFHGKRTASGEIFDMRAMTAAHKTLPFGARVRVRMLETNRSVVVRINDRGPFVEGRIIDLSHAAARRLGMVRVGTAPVALKVLEE